MCLLPRMSPSKSSPAAWTPAAISLARKSPPWKVPKTKAAVATAFTPPCAPQKAAFSAAPSASYPTTPTPLLPSCPCSSPGPLNPASPTPNQPSNNLRPLWYRHSCLCSWGFSAAPVSWPCLWSAAARRRYCGCLSRRPNHNPCTRVPEAEAFLFAPPAPTYERNHEGAVLLGFVVAGLQTGSWVFLAVVAADE